MLTIQILSKKVRFIPDTLNMFNHANVFLLERIRL